MDGIDLCELLEVGGRPPGGGGRPERPRRAAQDVRRRPGTLIGTLIIIQKHWEESEGTRVSPSRLFIKGPFFEDFVVFEGL